MSITQRVREWLEQHRGKSFCDACIATQLGLKGRRAVWRASSPEQAVFIAKKAPVQIAMRIG